MKHMRKISIAAVIGFLLSGCVVMNEPRVPSGTTPASGETKFEGFLHLDEVKKISRKCRLKHGQFELVMKVDTSQKPVKILEHNCKRLLVQTTDRLGLAPVPKLQNRVSRLSTNDVVGVDCVENQCQVTISVDNWPITRSRPLWTRNSSIDLFGRAATEIGEN